MQTLSSLFLIAISKKIWYEGKMLEQWGAISVKIRRERLPGKGTVFKKFTFAIDFMRERECSE